jgi:hypothetical protein
MTGRSFRWNCVVARRLAAKRDPHAEKVEIIRSTLAVPELLRSKFAALASIKLAVAVLAGLGG